MTTGEFTLDDFMRQMKQVRCGGPLFKVMTAIIPGMRQLMEQLNMSDDDLEKRGRHMWVIYDSMNYNERLNPEMLNASRRRRIASGAGVRVMDVINFLKQFEMSREMMRASR